MTPLRLTSWFRRRMLALVVASSVAAWLAVTVGYHVQARRDMVSLCRAEARHVATSLADTIQQRPVLWRYDAAKIADRIAAEGVRNPAGLEVRDANGVRVELGGLTRRRAQHLLWGLADVRVGGVVVAKVWVGADAVPLWHRTLVLGLVSALVTLALAALLYAIPVRVIRAAEQRTDALMRQLAMTLREEERGRIARDLHDGAGQALTAARLHLQALRRRAAQGDPEGNLGTAVSLIDNALDEVRRSTTALVPPALSELGLAGAIKRHCETFAAASGLAISCAVDPDLAQAGIQVETACYRIVQEALTNIARHSGAQNARVTVSIDGGEIRLAVQDDGPGHREEATANSGHGLQSIQTRAALLKGSARLSHTDAGTCLEVVLPFPRETT